MEQPSSSVFLHKKDLIFGLVAGVLVGILLLPILNAAKPELYQAIRVFVIPFFLIAIPVGLVVASLLSRFLPVFWQLAKFIVTGGLNFVVDLGILTLLISFFRSALGASPELLIVSVGIPITAYSFYKGLSFILANINSYLWNKYWTFDAQQPSTKATSQFGSFITVSLIGLVINTVTASIVFKSIIPFAGMTVDQWSLIGAVCGAVAGLVWNFVGYKFIVFKQ